MEVFYKQFEYQKPSWRYFCQQFKAQRDFSNYPNYSCLGISCADPIACGVERDSIARLRCAFILTRAVTNSQTLTQGSFLDLIFFPRAYSGAKTVFSKELQGLLDPENAHSLVFM